MSTSNSFKVTIAVGIGWLVAGVGRSAGAEVQFNRDIRPIFHQHCVACHGGVKQAAELSFVYRQQALTVIEPGSPDDSYLIGRVSAEDEGERMPPPEHGRRLSAEEIDLLRRWIRQGAPWQDHWAYVAPHASDLPALKNEGWSRTPIDHFILARLEKEGLSPSPEATPDRWLRRVSLDLIGLPPTPEERRTFLSAASRLGEAAYASEVERLLSSPHFGHRWASVWLDLVRYADSKGLGQDGRRTIWKYRDWVIDALNRDLPFDEFSIKQLAGDLLPETTMNDLVATACHRLTQTNEEGGTDDEQFRTEAVIDRVNTTWQVWQGLTFGCVQCHNHPYEPIRHQEYYQYLSFFNNTVDCDLSNDEPRLRVPLEEEDYVKARDLDRRMAVLQEREWRHGFQLLAEQPSKWHELIDLEATTNNDTEVAVDKSGARAAFHTVGTVSRNTAIVVEASLPEAVDQVTAIRFTGLPRHPEKAKEDSEWGFVLSHVKAEWIPPDSESPIRIKLSRVIGDEPEPFFDPQLSLDADSPWGFGAYSRMHYPRQAALVLAEPVEVAPGARLRVTLSHQVFELGAFPLVTRRGRLAVSGDDSFSRWLTDPDVLAVRQELQELTRRRAAIQTVPIPTMRERPARLSRPTHVFVRGNFLTKGQPVSSKTPEVLPPLSGTEKPTRLDLARWIVSPNHPLTARVVVNRLWAQMFEMGLVETQEDFGSSGEPPSHPELLDDLAVRLATDMQWSLKTLLQEIALSSTYRQSSRMSQAILARDPRNRLLARGPRTRLPAETIRDQALAIAGLLSDELYGPPVHPPLPAHVWNPFQGGDKWTTPKKGDPDRYRRSIYTYTKRTIPFPMFASFDAPSREFCTARRLRSNTPLQALMTLNDETFIEASQALARRMLESADTPEEQIAHGVLLATCREARASELEKLVQLYGQTKQMLIADTSVPPSEEPAFAERAMTNVANVLLNLDEVLCK